MSDIELVIKIPEEDYKKIIEYGECDYLRIINAIENGMPLPERHGDLKDANNLKHAFISWSMAVHGDFTDADIASIILNSPTIIEKDGD